MEEDQKDEILHLNFNSDNSTFTCATQSCIKIFTTDPFLEYYHQELNGGIAFLEKLNNSNQLALIGGGTNPKYNPQKLMLWCDYKQQSIRELTYKEVILKVKNQQNKMVVIFESQIKIYNNSDLKLLQIVKIPQNPEAIVSVNSDLQQEGVSNNLMFAYPEASLGHVKVHNFEQQSELTIKAHQNAIQILQLNMSGQKLATSSEKGTIIRIFETRNGQLLQELRRGSENAIINCINFDHSSKFLVCSSDSGTIHVFAVNLSDQEKELIKKQNKNNKNNDIEEYKNPTSALGFLKKGELSIAQLRIPEKRSIVAFGPARCTIIVLTYEGKFYKASFDPSVVAECVREEEEYILPAEQVNGNLL